MRDDGFRRLFPPPRRRPRLGTVLLRWWREGLAVTATAAACWAWGWQVPVVAVVALGVATAVPGVRRTVRGVVRSLVVLHRLRVGFVQAGVANRDGRLPLLVGVRFSAAGDQVRVRAWCRAGTPISDLVAAEEVLATACGAADVRVVQPSPRRDRVIVVVVRSRWGWLT